MNKVCVFLLCFFSVFCFAQEYHFDYFIKTESIRTKPNKKKWITNSFYDSVNNNTLYLSTQGDKTMASVYDKESNKIHVFKVSKIKNELDFVYKHSNQFEDEKKNSYKEEIIKVEKIDSLKYNVVVFKNSKLKKKIMQSEITLEKSDFNYFKIEKEGRREDDIVEQLKPFLNPNFKYIIKSQQVEYPIYNSILGGNIQKIQKTTLNLKIPDQLIIKDFDYWAEFED